LESTELIQRIFGSGLALIDDATKIELLLMMKRKDLARKYVRHFLAGREDFELAVASLPAWHRQRLDMPLVRAALVSVIHRLR
jgi:hypothetical protein